jgi:hypothetical protein
LKPAPVHETLSQKTHHKKRAGGVAQGIVPEFKLQYHKKKKKKIKKDTHLRTRHFLALSHTIGEHWVTDLT